MSIKKFIMFAMLIALFKMDSCVAGDDTLARICVMSFNPEVNHETKRLYEFPMKDVLSAAEIKQKVLRHTAPRLDSNDPRVLNQFVLGCQNEFVSSVKYSRVKNLECISLVYVPNLVNPHFNLPEIDDTRVALEVSMGLADFESRIPQEHKNVISKSFVEKIKKYVDKNCNANEIIDDNARNDMIALREYVLSDESSYSEEQKVELRSIFEKSGCFPSNTKKASAAFSDEPRPSKESSEYEDSTRTDQVDQMVDVQPITLPEEIKNETSPGLHVSPDGSAVLNGTAEEIKDALFAHSKNLSTIESLVIRNPDLNSIPADLGKAFNLKKLDLSGTGIVEANDTNGLISMLQDQGCVITFPVKNKAENKAS